jgi:hypothetical protein
VSEFTSAAHGPRAGLFEEILEVRPFFTLTMNNLANALQLVVTLEPGSLTTKRAAYVATFWLGARDSPWHTFALPMSFSTT